MTATFTPPVSRLRCVRCLPHLAARRLAGLGRGAASAAGAFSASPPARFSRVPSLPDTGVTTMRIFSGIQPTGAKHLGNYSGGFRQYTATQEEGDAFFCIVDLHSITVQHDPENLRRSTLDLASMFFAT